VSLEQELAGPPAALQKLSRLQGERILNLARETSTVRYRELYGFTHGDAGRVLKASLGRGVELFLVGLPPAARLPLRAYHAAMIFKNGVPVGYFEGLSLFERMESGFNFYYTFREGETAWIYARTLAVVHQLLGITAFSIDPYQVGHENVEGIASGAFWFYRKLGFRPTKPELLRLTVKEEQKLASRPAYRSSPRTLRQLAQGSMIFELPQARHGEWDRFQVRRLGLLVQQHMERKARGSATQLRRQCMARVKAALGLKSGSLNERELVAFGNLSLVLALIPSLATWDDEDKRSLLRIIRAKAGADEAAYLRLQQRHLRLRSELISLGS